MIVADASAAVHALLNDGDARAALGREPVVVPHLADCEVASTLGSGVARGDLAAGEARDALLSWMVFGCERVGITGLLDRVWELRENVTAYDAAYLALAETMDCELVTADERMARAPGARCRFAVVRD